MCHHSTTNHNQRADYTQNAGYNHSADNKQRANMVVPDSMLARSWCIRGLLAACHELLDGVSACTSCRP
jgi:hypothetical protein